MQPATPPPTAHPPRAATTAAGEALRTERGRRQGGAITVGSESGTESARRDPVDRAVDRRSFDDTAEARPLELGAGKPDHQPHDTEARALTGPAEQPFRVTAT
ncbi:hypothetical protein [Streptomyces triticiradicis]|uniref:Uncharacterized protein n=1 Tax=Streptomyces triticiradicis TaxID=2651189 RepID=A0A7J5DBC8_9ACTN|nr:hypothetical protein [Streptomyces triticiradicis]KAB1985787.1 hypothetical protein F8144_26315 [Streptomyces triticiradicis]